MQKIKYIYFEIAQRVGYNSTKKEFRNENVLLIKPHTNSNGIWRYSNMTERKGFGNSNSSFSMVEQYWIDLGKFSSPKDKRYDNLKIKVDEVLEIINKKMRGNKIEEVLKED